MYKVCIVLIIITQVHYAVSTAKLLQCVRKFAVHLQKMLEVMSTSFYTVLNTFNFIRKHFLQVCVRKFAVDL
jgi:hypothetical protein